MTRTITDRYLSLHEVIETPENHTEVEFDQAVTDLLAFAEEMVQKNAHLTARLASTEKLLTETDIQLGLAQLEVFNFENQLPKTNQKGTNAH